MERGSWRAGRIGWLPRPLRKSAPRGDDSGKPASINVLDRDGVEIDTIEASNVDGPYILRCAWASERQDAAGRTKVVSRDMRVPLIEGQIVQGREQPETIRGHAMDQGAAFSTDRTVTHPDVIQDGVDLEPHATTMTGTSIGYLHLTTL